MMKFHECSQLQYISQITIFNVVVCGLSLPSWPTVSLPILKFGIDGATNYGLPLLFG